MTRNRQWLVAGGIVGFLIALVIGAWMSRDDLMTPIDVGRDAPDIAATDLEGNVVQLSDLEGKVVLLNIWATWCPPCVEEMPSMQRLYDQIAHPDFEIVAVSIDAEMGQFGSAGHTGGDVAAFADRFDLTFPIWRDPEGNIQRVYRATAVPESFLIDRDGQIIKKVVGGTIWDAGSNVELIHRLLDTGVALESIDGRSPERRAG